MNNQKIGILTTNDPALCEWLTESFPCWVIAITPNSKVIEFFPLPNQQPHTTVESPEIPVTKCENKCKP